MNKGSSPGLSGLSFDMIKQLADDKYCIAGIKAIVQDIINDKLPKQAKEYLLSANLIAFPKPNNSLRPIAISETLYRLAASYAMSLIDVSGAMKWSPIQFGVGMSSGSERLVHIINNRLAVDNKICLSIDFRNAFNSIDRNHVVSTFYNHIEFQPLFRIVNFSYSEPTPLFAMNQDGQLAQLMTSHNGVRQGDPLSALLFAMAVNDMYSQVESMHRVEVMAYLDDCYVIAEPQDSEQLILAYNSLERLADQIGLQVQPAKSMAIDFNSNIDTASLLELETLHIPIQTLCAPVLGTVVSKNMVALQNVLLAQTTEQHSTLMRLLECRHMPTQLAMLFIRICTTPKLN